MDAKYSSTSPARWSVPGLGVFTLVELMVVMALAGALMLFGVPNYQDHVRRAAIEKATNVLGTTRIVAEQYRADRRTYVGAPCSSRMESFILSCNFAAMRFVLTASGSDALDGFVFTLDDQGRRGTRGPWGSGDCWIIQRGGTCAKGAMLASP